MLYIQASDSGGELDPHGPLRPASALELTSSGADGRGNPIGSLMYSNAFGGSSSGETQVQEWFVDHRSGPR